MLEVIKFEADWCGPCQQLKPVFTDVVAEYKSNDRVKLSTVNVDTNAELTVKYQISGIPAIVFVIDGEVKSKLVGFKSKKIISAEIEKYISECV
jgi:thioredoxin 1